MLQSEIMASKGRNPRDPRDDLRNDPRDGLRNDPRDGPQGAGTYPLTTRSILLSLLLGSHPPVMTVAALVEFAGLFGIADGTVRTALSRMVDRGELLVDDATYRLSGPLLARQAEQDIGRRRFDDGWDGAWYAIIVTSDRRSLADRRVFRARAVGAKLGELRPGLWMRPANIDISADLHDALITRGPLLAGSGADLARSLWDLASIDDASMALTAALGTAGNSLHHDGPAGIPQAFATLALALRHLRTEPQLPAALHPTNAGDRLRAHYDEVEHAFRRTLAEFLRHDVPAP